MKRQVLAVTLTAAMAIATSPSVFSSRPAVALSPEDIRGPCKSEYQKWRKRAGYGAFAYSPNKYCAATWENISIRVARSHALQLCRKRKIAKDCQIIAENEKPSTYVQNFEQCGSSSGNAKIDTCTFVIEQKRKGYDNAWAYNERGRAFADLGKTDLAAADFTGALRQNKRYGSAWWNRALLRKEMFDYEHAISDAKAALKFYQSGGGDYRQAAKDLISEIEFEMKRQRPDDNSRLCTLALSSITVAWEQDPRYAIAVNEAERRGLTAEKCRNLLGREP
jgi:tetratricopeptide (TPR) repeat protein